MDKIISIEEAVKKVKKGDKIGTSGFLGVAAPLKLIDALVEEGTDELTLMQVVTSYPYEEHDVGRLAENNQIKKFVGAHTGTSKAVNKQYLNGDIEVDYIPMGTFVEALHAGGAGLGGIITPTGIGTDLEKDRDKITRNGKEYLIYDPITVDVAFIKANKADKFGNLYAKDTNKGVIKDYALASKITIAEVEEIVEVGEIEPTDVEVPGVLVDYIVQGRTRQENMEYYENLWSKYNLLKEEEK